MVQKHCWHAVRREHRVVESVEIVVVCEKSFIFVIFVRIVKFAAVPTAVVVAIVVVVVEFVLKFAKLVVKCSTVLQTLVQAFTTHSRSSFVRRVQLFGTLGTSFSNRLCCVILKKGFFYI